MHLFYTKYTEGNNQIKGVRLNDALHMRDTNRHTKTTQYFTGKYGTDLGEPYAYQGSRIISFHVVIVGIKVTPYAQC